MAEFYNPYHFVPVHAPSDTQKGVKRKAVAEKTTHERYTAGTHSGRVVLRLTTVTPLVVGAQQERPNREYAKVDAYKVDGMPAIPASSLRGMAGSVIEAATCSPLRVLQLTPYSFRRKMTEGLSAIGLVVQVEKDPHRFGLKPMCLPTLVSQDGGRTFAVPPAFRRLFPAGPQFKVYFGDAKSIRSSGFAYRTAGAAGPVVEMPVKQLLWNGNVVTDDRTLRVKASRFAVAQDADRADPPRPGRVRVLGCWGDRERDIPTGKKHELWVPEPHPKAPILPISPNAIERFHSLADERTAADGRLPFEPRDTRPGRRPGDPLRLQAGDMVFFDVNAAGTEVIEISFSSIWRSRVEEAAGRPSTSHAFFADIHPDLLPLNPSREHVSSAELLLGVVEDVPSGSPPNHEAFALASRLRFSDALPLIRNPREDLLLPETKLKILASPKPPCPAMYFKTKAGSDYIAKQQLSVAKHTPQGRKFYLHSQPGSGAPWETRKPDEEKDQKSCVRPVKANSTFFFHVDFDNLTDVELGLLLFGLQPAENFHHKLGMGKPLGLGSVKVDVLGVFLVDRTNRYSVGGLRADRWALAELTGPGRELQSAREWPLRYRAEGQSPAGGAVCARALDAATVLTDPAARKALLILGDYRNAPAASSVHYPSNADQLDKESEHFQWFVFNDGQQKDRRGMSPSHQYLKPVGSTLPALKEQ
jgi:CRISPR-associated protein (TIGR03986 family)